MAFGCFPCKDPKSDCPGVFHLLLVQLHRVGHAQSMGGLLGMRRCSCDETRAFVRQGEPGCSISFHPHLGGWQVQHHTRHSLTLPTAGQAGDDAGGVSAGRPDFRSAPYSYVSKHPPEWLITHLSSSAKWGYEDVPHRAGQGDNKQT